MSKWLVAMTAGKWQLDGILAAKKMGFKVLGIDGSKEAVGLNSCDQALVTDIADRKSLLEKIRELNIKPSGVVSYCSEAGMLPAAWIREEFSLPGMFAEETLKFLRKDVQRKVWQDSGVEDLKWVLVDNFADATKAAQYVGFPLIIKPVDSSGSRGVSKVESSEELELSFTKAQEGSRSKKVLVEEYMDGTEYTIEAFTSEGVTKILAVTEKAKVVGSRGTVASELAYPTVSADLIENIKIKVLQAVKALNYENGPTHTEVILRTKNKKVGLVEMAARGGGFGVFSKLVPLASGVDISHLLISQAMGEKNDITKLPVQQNIFSLKFFPTTQKGTVKAIHGFDEAGKIDGVEVGSFVEIGQAVDNDFLDGNRMGYILAKAHSLSALHEVINKVENLISFEVV